MIDQLKRLLLIIFGASAFGSFAFGSAALAQSSDQSREMTADVALNPSGQTVLPIDRTNLPSARPDGSVILQFQSLESAVPLAGYYEVFLVVKNEGDEMGQGIYVGNLDFFGADPASRASNSQVSVNKSIDITSQYFDDSNGTDFANHGVAVMLRPVTTANPAAQSAPVNVANIGKIVILTEP